MVLNYPGNEDELLIPQIPSSDVHQTSPPSSPNPFFQNEPDIIGFNFDFLDPSDESEPQEADLGDESIPSVASTEFHPVINGMYLN